jgi:PAS domain-containing protein
MTSERVRDPLHGTVVNLAVGFQVIDFDWRYVCANPTAAAHGRIGFAELDGRSMLDLFPDIEDTAMFRVLERCMNDRVADEFDHLFMFPDGEARWFEIRVEPVTEGICIYSIDIHDRKLCQLEIEAKGRDVGIHPPLTRDQWRLFMGGQMAES